MNTLRQFRWINDLSRGWESFNLRFRKVRNGFCTKAIKLRFPPGGRIRFKTAQEATQNKGKCQAREPQRKPILADFPPNKAPKADYF
jgi:hypothetical protein